MLYYPQLLTGCISQYPITRHTTRRTIVNQLADGVSIRMADSGASQTGWGLSYQHLTLAEVSGLEELFQAASGSWQTFTFLDPTDNLFAWSEDLAQPVWKLDPLLALGVGLQDPLGAQAGTKVTNTAQVRQQLVQTLPIPGSYQYCLSVFVRSDQPGSIELFGSAGNAEIHTDVTAGPVWTRVVHPFQISSQTDELSAGIRLPSGGSVSIFGLQLEAQSGAGGYKKTRDRAGVYSKSRFEEDAFRSIATGVNQYSCQLRVLCNVAG